MNTQQTKGKFTNSGIKKNSYYDIHVPYTQREKDNYRISEGCNHITKNYVRGSKNSLVSSENYETSNQ